MKILTLSALLIIATGMAYAQQSAKMNYPPTAKIEQKDNYHGNIIADPYRWLEDDTAKAVSDWVDQQNAITDKYIAQIPFTSKIRERLEKLFNHARYTMPDKVGSYYFFRKNDGLQNQSVIYKQKGLSGAPEVFIDPNTISKDGTVTTDLSGASLDKKYIAVSISRSGSDWQELEVYEVATGKKLKDKIDWVKFSGAAWGKGGFYYSRYDKPVDGKAFSNKNEFHKIYFHKLGTSQNDDQLIYMDKEHPLRYFGSFLSRDGRYMFISGSEGTSGNELMVKNLTIPNSEFVTICKGFKFNYDVAEVAGDKAYILTDDNAPNYKLVSFDLKNPNAGKFKTIIPETADLLQSVRPCGGKFFAQYLKNV
jgi:prolyl oligopeptidase